ncbi:MAG: hypothetical protein ACRED5_19105 [Propylenella sp.]
MKATRILLFLEALAFAAAALVHSGIIPRSNTHHQAAIAESAIAGVLFLGWSLTFLSFTVGRGAAITVQGLALFGAIIGVVMTMIGIGPQTIPNTVFQLTMLILLMGGLIAFARA